jgi:lysophospholipase L1-like esterase
MMKNTVYGLLAGVLSSALASFAQEPEKPTFEFKDADTLVLLGGTTLERDQRYGHLESALSLALGEKKLTVRNLAWSGDTVNGDARSYFGPPSEGLQRLETQLELIKPTVVLLNYGTDLAHAGLKAMPDFLTSYRNLLDLIRKKCPGVRLIIASPAPMETLDPPLPDQSDANKKLGALSEALETFAATQNAFFLDWFQLMGGPGKAGRTPNPLTENGIHYTPAGFAKLAAVTVKALHLTPADVPSAATEPIRQAIVKKDFLFFNRYRPQNETYLFGFRKHEQGQNGKEIPMFDPLVLQADAAIHEAKLKALADARRP